MHACSWYRGSEVLGCRTLRLVSQSSAGLRMQPYPRSPDLVWPGHLHGTGCLSARAMDTGFPTVAWRLCLGLGCGWVQVSAAPGTLAWGVGVCVCLCVCSPCTQPLLARVRGVGVCVWARVSAAPRHSWLGCWAVCVLRLHPATTGHGCAVWVCVFGLGFRLRPATPGWGVGLCVCSACTQPLLATGARCGCVCLGSRFGCAPPLLAGVLGCVCAPLAPSYSWPRVHGVGVCVWARVSAAPRHSWLGCWAVCVLLLHPATPGTGARCGCVCLGSGVGCAPPLLAGVLGCVCAPLTPSHSWPRVHGVGVCVWARVSAAPHHSWLGCWAVCVLRLHAATPGHGCAVWMCVFRLGFRLRPATPGWGVGLCVCSACTQPLLATGARCGFVCLGSGFGCAPPLLAGVLGCVCAPLAPSHSWPRVRGVGVCVFRLGFRLRPATPGWGVGLCAWSACTQPLLATGARCGCVCLGSGFGCAPPLLGEPLGCVRAPLAPSLYWPRVRGVGVCVWARVSAAPRHSWLGCWAVCVLRLYPATPGLGCALWMSVFGLGFWLRPATPGWGVGLCVCSACTQPLLARVRGVGVCVWARVSAAPCHSWLGCWALCVLRLHLATPGHGCAVWVCVFGLGFWLRAATPGWGVGLCVCSACTQPLLATAARCGCVCLGSGFGCASPLLARVLGCVCAPLAPSHSWPRLRVVGVCVSARVSAAPRHSWLECWAVCVLRLHPATPGHGCAVWVCEFGLGFWLHRHSWLGCWAVCVLRLHPATPGHGCALWVCVFPLGFRLRPATPGWNVGLCVCSACPQPILATDARCGCVCLGSGFGCAPPLLAGVLGCVRAPLAPSHSWPRLRGVGVCVWARVSAAPRHCPPGCWAVCVLRLHPATPGHGCAVWVCVFWLGFWLRPATPGWDVGLCVCSACTQPLLATDARCGCVCLGSGFGCAPPLLAGVLGCARAPLAPSQSWPRLRGVGVCVWARVSAALRHSWLGCWAVCVLRLHPATPGHGCAVWVCVFGLGFRLRPATPGWGVGLCAWSACTQPLLATGARCGCVCLCSGFGCASPLLAGVLGCVRGPLAPSHSWPRVRVWVCVFGLGFRLRPATPGWGVGLCVCSACTQPLLATGARFGCVCFLARVSAAPCHSWLGCWAVCVLLLHPATPGTGARCGCVCLGSGVGCALPLLAGVLGCVCALFAPSLSWPRPRGVGVCVWARVLAAPCHSWLGCWAVCVLRLHPATPGHGCAVRLCVFGLGFRLRPATPGWGVGLCAWSACTQPLLATGARCGCVCLGSGFGCAPPLPAGVLGCVCAPLAPSHSWHGCAVWVCVFGLGCRLRPATPGRGVGLCACSACTQPLLATGARCGCVCLGSGFGCAPPLLAGVLGCVCAPLAPSHSWPRPRGVGVCVCARVSAATRHSRLGCWAVCVLRLHPATPGHGCAVRVCVFGLGFRLRPATRGWGVGLCAWSACTQPLLATGARCGCVCFGSGFGCAPPLLAGVLGCVCALLAPSHSWPRVRGVGVCVWARVSAAPGHS